jgi:hypothetical protein
MYSNVLVPEMQLSKSHLIQRRRNRRTFRFLDLLSTSQKPKEKKPKLEDADASTYFETSNKIKRVAAPQRKTPVKKETKKEKNDDDDFLVDDDDFDFDEDLMQEIDFPVKEVPKSTNGANQMNGQPKDAVPASTATNTTSKTEQKTTPAKRKVVDTSSDDDFVEPKPVSKAVKVSKPTSTKKESAEPVAVAKGAPALKKTPTKAAKPPTKATPKTTKKADSKESEEDLERKAVLESVETVDLPDAEPTTGEDKKYILSSVSN